MLTANAFTGETLAAELRDALHRHGLLNVLTARYVHERGAIRLVWIRGAEAIDVPATSEWVVRVRASLPAYVRGRASA
jgi:hypothetical protein